MTISKHQQVTRFLPAEADTLAIGAQLSSGLVPGLVIYLDGDLGTGKTTLVRGLLRSLGLTERVKSPTFSLVEVYTLSSLYLYHFDFYRFKRTEEWAEAGFREHFGAATVCIVEWPEKAGAQLPAADVRIKMEVSGSGRSITISAESEAGRNCLIPLQN